MAEHSVDYEPQEISDEELAQKKAQLEDEIEERRETEDEGLTYHGSYEDVPVQEAKASRDPHYLQTYWICPCSGVSELIPKGSKCRKCGRSEPTSGKEPFVTRYY